MNRTYGIRGKSMSGVDDAVKSMDIMGNRTVMVNMEETKSFPDQI